MMKILEMCDIIVKLAETHLGVTPASTPISSPLLLEEVTSIRPPLHARSRSGHGSVTSENSWHSGTFSSPEVQQSVDIINFVVALKQLEVSLSQAKICLSVFGQDKAAQVTYSLMEQSAGLHDRINVLIESTCG